jgi:signal transduction histidine kinase
MGNVPAARPAQQTSQYRRRLPRARPLHLRVEVAWRDGLEILIEDDGVGFGTAGPSTADSGQGLALHSTMMAVVGGTLAVESLPGAYMRVLLTLPQGSR